MEDGSLKILGLAGSLRRASFHRGLIRAAQELAPGDTMVEPYERLDEIPFFNQDVEDQGDPAPVKEFKEKIRQANAFLIAVVAQSWEVREVVTVQKEPQANLVHPIRFGE